MNNRHYNLAYAEDEFLLRGADWERWMWVFLFAWASDDQLEC